MIIDFSKFSSVKIGGKHKVFVIQNIEQTLKDEFKDYVLIGGGNNILISNNPPKIAILGKEFEYIKFNNNILEIGATTKNGKIYNFAKKHNLGGFEFLKNIPGTLGGMLKMNAGLCGISISDNLSEILLKRGWVQKSEINFSYRYSGIDEPIFAGKFLIKNNFNENLAADFESKRTNQPKGASFGSCFTNPNGDYAGRLIEAVGLKGYAIGGAKFSEKHANFLINYNNATFENAIDLINLAKKLVYEKFGIELKTEVIVL